MNVRMASSADIDLLVKVRFDYFAAEKWEVSPEQKAIIESSLRRYYPAHLGRDFFAAFMEADGDIASVAFLAVAEMPANLGTPTGKYGTVLNVHTYLGYRRKGYAAAALNAIIDIAKEQNLSYVGLSASEAGKLLYEKLGFREPEPSHFTEMRLSLI